MVGVILLSDKIPTLHICSLGPVRKAYYADLHVTSWSNWHIYQWIDNSNQSPVGHDQAHQAAAGAVLASYVEEGETRFHCFFVSFAKQQLRGDTKSGRVKIDILAIEAVLLLQAFDDFNHGVMPTERNIKIRQYITKVCYYSDVKS